LSLFNSEKEEILSINGFDLNVDELERRLELAAAVTPDYACGANACAGNGWPLCGANACAGDILPCAANVGV